jgi:hypothetical protein
MTLAEQVKKMCNISEQKMDRLCVLQKTIQKLSQVYEKKELQKS